LYMRWSRHVLTSCMSCVWKLLQVQCYLDLVFTSKLCRSSPGVCPCCCPIFWWFHGRGPEWHYLL
jgi:hypothetical protein